jgi:hypothetical protein
MMLAGIGRIGTRFGVSLMHRKPHATEVSLRCAAKMSTGVCLKPFARGSVSMRPRVAIVGAGFGGLWAAKTLALGPVEVIVIDGQNYHLFQPLLYQVATAGLSPADIAAPIRRITVLTETSPSCSGRSAASTLRRAQS